jgi:hypothetical protein
MIINMAHDLTRGLKQTPPDIGWPLDSEIPDLTGPATYWVETLQTETAVVNGSDVVVNGRDVKIVRNA